MKRSVIEQTAADLTSYKRDPLWAVYRAHQAHDTPVGADVKRELETLGQTNTEGSNSIHGSTNSSRTGFSRRAIIRTTPAGLPAISPERAEKF